MQMLLLMVWILQHVSRPHSVQDGGCLSSIVHLSNMRLPYPSQLDGLYGLMAHIQQGYIVTPTLLSNVGYLKIYILVKKL